MMNLLLFLENKIKNKFNNLIDILNSSIINSYGYKWNVVLINEYPKCGASWLRNILSETLGINKNRGNWNKYRIMGIVGRNSIIQRHWKLKVNCRTIIMLRDPRDVMVSFYFFEKFFLKNFSLINNYSDGSKFKIEEEIEQYIRVKTENSTLSTPGFNYIDFWNFYKNNNDVMFIKYEDLKKDTFNVVKKALNYIENTNVSNITIEKVIKENNIHKMKKKDKRNEGFYRKGIIGDWQNYFTDNAKDYFKLKYSNMLVEMGYEKDNNW